MISRNVLIVFATFGLTQAASAGNDAGSGTGMGNPATVKCVELGGTSVMTDESIGLCQFGDALIEEWTLFRAASGETQDAVKAFLDSTGELPPFSGGNPASVNCADKGGTTENVTTAAGELGLCTFPDHSQIEEWTLARGPSTAGYEGLAKILRGDDDVMIHKEISGDAGDHFMDALMNAGVSDTSGLLGATNISASRVTCTAAVVPNPVPRCDILWNDSTLAPAEVDAAALYQALVDNGGVVDTGLVGAIKAEATNLKCSRVVYPGAQATCSFDVAAQR